MPAYAILDLSIHDPAGMEEYRKYAPAAAAAFDGKFIVRGGKSTVLEGEWKTDRIVILEFPSIERANEWWHSEQYTKARKIREGAARTKVMIIEGV